MRAVIRTYSGPGAKKLFAELEKNKAKIETLIKPVKGLVSYSLVNTGDGGMSVTVCKDQKGIDDSVADRRRVDQGKSAERRDQADGHRGRGRRSPDLAGSERSAVV